MKNTFGNQISITLFGESHGKAIGAVLDGVPSGIAVDEAFIARQMEKRKGINSISTPRREVDAVKILSGVFDGRTTGTPICFMVENTDIKSKDYSLTKDLARPGHADYTAEKRYGGFQDYRGGGHFSGRLTAPLVAAGALALSMLREKGIEIATHISSCGEIKDREFGNLAEDIRQLENLSFPVLSEKAGKEILSYIEKAKKEGDSVGGTLTTVVTGMPAGVGEPWFDSVESMLSHGLFSIPGVKGVEFGKGFGFAEMMGSDANDEFTVVDGEIVTVTNNNGGINGGITNGMPILFRCAVRPTPSIFKEQTSVRLSEMKEENLRIEGRHDPAIIHRVRAVVDAAAAIAVADMLAVRYGTDYLALEVEYE